MLLRMFLRSFFALQLFSTLLNASENILSYAFIQGLQQGAILLRSQNVKKRLRDPNLSSHFKESLQLSLEILEYAKSKNLKTKGSYKNFVELDRDWVTKVVIAAKKDKLELHQFQFPIVGAFPYKGYFDEEDAENEAKKLSAQLDVYTRKVPAFSSLGWFSDPITSNLFARPSFLIETLFHELVHLNFYFDNEADFNEAFATWYADKISTDFIELSQVISDKEKLKAEFQQGRAFDKELASFMDEVLASGNRFYSQKQDEPAREKFFSSVSNCLENYPALVPLKKIKWNNASLLSLSTYYKVIPVIEAYAVKKRLTYASFLELVLKRGSGIVQEIMLEKVESPLPRCSSLFQ